MTAPSGSDSGSQLVATGSDYSKLHSQDDKSPNLFLPNGLFSSPLTLRLKENGWLGFSALGMRPDDAAQILSISRCNYLNREHRRAGVADGAVSREVDCSGVRR